MKGHERRELRHNGERSREESAWTASCACGWTESCRRKGDAAQEHRWHIEAVKKRAVEKTKADGHRIGTESIGITRIEGETWRECVARLVTARGDGLTEDALAEYDLQVRATSPEWAALKACWDYLACDVGPSAVERCAELAECLIEIVDDDSDILGSIEAVGGIPALEEDVQRRPVLEGC